MAESGNKPWRNCKKYWVRTTISAYDMQNTCEELANDGWRIFQCWDVTEPGKQHVSQKVLFIFERIDSEQQLDSVTKL